MPFLPSKKIGNTLAFVECISFAGNNHGNVLLSKSITEFEFGGVKCDLLISHGVIKNYAWTLDFEKMLYTFSL